MATKNESFIKTIEVEEDMMLSAIKEEDGLTKRVFKKCPLLGDYVINEKSFDILCSNVKKYIDFRMSSEGIKLNNTLNRNVYEQTVLAVVNFAKEWNSNEEGKFTRYIAMKFGYKTDFSGRVWEIITEAIEIALNVNNKFFIRREDGRQFYETVMAHSMGPKGSWFPLIELLFSFYKDNLDWNYVPGDPLFVRFVLALQRHFNNESSDDDYYLIA